jgi:hypothetical protein
MSNGGLANREASMITIPGFEIIPSIMTTKESLKCLKDTDPQEKMKETIDSTLFNVMPIISDNKITKYFDKKLKEKRRIDFDDTINIESEIFTLLEMLTKKNVLFVTDKSEVCGMITRSDLNKKAISLYLYSLMVDLEREMSILVKNKLNHEEILEFMKKQNDSESSKDGYSRYKNDQEKNLDADIVEYLYFTDLINIIKKNGIYKSIGIESASKFEEFNSLNEIRKSIMHPVKSLISNTTDLEKLKKQIKSIELLIFKIKNR